MTQTLEHIRREGLAALRAKLGRAGAVRFLQQFDSGRGDYVRERRDWVDRTSMADLRKLAGKRRKRG